MEIFGILQIGHFWNSSESQPLEIFKIRNFWNFVNQKILEISNYKFKLFFKLLI